MQLPHKKYELIKNIVNSQSYVSEFALHDYPIPESKYSVGGFCLGLRAEHGQYRQIQLGWASIGICTHALYEAVRHAANRTLYGMKVTDFHTSNSCLPTPTPGSSPEAICTARGGLHGVASSKTAATCSTSVVKMKVTHRARRSST